MNRKLTIALVLYIAFVFIQSLFFKFTGAEDTQHIFGILDAWAAETFGYEGLFLPPGPFNAYVIGTAELIASIILLVGIIKKVDRFIPIGAAISIIIMTGAISFHLFTPLGINVNGDGGTLFAMAVGVWLASFALLYGYRDRLFN